MTVLLSFIMVTQGVTIKAAPIVSYDAYDANDVYLDNSLLLYNRDVCFSLFRVKTTVTCCLDRSKPKSTQTRCFINENTIIEIPKISVIVVTCVI